jgi:hypothetical protein
MTGVVLISAFDLRRNSGLPVETKKLATVRHRRQFYFPLPDRPAVTGSW